MKNNNADKVLMEKLGSLDTLSGGIVYGKEEAWEKLQGRLDAKPAKRIELKYGMAAALVILLGFTGFYFYPAKQNSSTKTSVAKIASDPRLVTPANIATQPETTAVYTSANIKEIAVQKTNGAQVSHTSRVWDTSTAATPEAPAVNQVAIQTASTPATPKPMPVVSINELENQNLISGAHAAAIAGNEPVDFKKMPVLYINDVLNEEHEIKALRHENRFSFGRQLFSKPVYNEYQSSGSEEQPVPHHLLKNIFNAQN